MKASTQATDAVRPPVLARSASRNGSTAATEGATIWHRLLPLACALITAAALSPSLGNQFVDWDDDRNLVDNPNFRGLAWQNLRWMFTTTLMGHWIPFTWITFGADYLVWGLDPFGYHLTNLLLHSAAAVAFYFVALRLLRLAIGGGGMVLGFGACAAALFFAIHPLRVESVAWATERRDVLSGLWFLLTILTYLVAADAEGARRRWWLAGSVACYALALGSKASVMALPVVLLVLDVYPLRRLGPDWRDLTTRRAGQVMMEKTPYVLLALAAAGMATRALRAYGETLPSETAPIARRVAVAFYGLWFYVWKTFIPFAIWPLYRLPDRVDPWAFPMVGSVTAVCALTVGCLWLRKRRPAGLAVWTSYVALLAPVSGLVQSGPQLVAARYSYLPCLGWAVLVGAAVSVLARRAASGQSGHAWARIGIGAVAASLAGLGALSSSQTRIWHDSETLWSYVVSVDPGSEIGHNNLGLAYLKQERLEAAEHEIRSSLAVDPDYELAQTNLAVVLLRQGRFEEAGEARARLGLLLLKHQKYSAAVELFQKEVNARSDDPAAHNNLGAALLLQGDVERAVEHFEEALRLDPGHEKARRNLAAARQGR